MPKYLLEQGFRADVTYYYVIDAPTAEIADLWFLNDGSWDDLVQCMGDDLPCTEEEFRAITSHHIGGVLGDHDGGNTQVEPFVAANCYALMPGAIDVPPMGNIHDTRISVPRDALAELLTLLQSAQDERLRTLATEIGRDLLREGADELKQTIN